MSLTLSYWPGVQGKASILRYLLAYGKAEYTEAHQDPTNYAKWLFEIKPALSQQAPLINLPYIQLDCGKIISCTSAIKRYLGRKYGLMGKDDSQQVLIDMCLDVLSDFREGFFNGVMKNKTESPVVQMFNQTYGLRWIGPLEAIAAQNGPYICGDSITMADVQFLEISHRMLRWKPSLLDNFPTLKEIYEKLIDHPELGAQAAKEDALPVTFQYTSILEKQVEESKNNPMIQKMCESLPELFWGPEGMREAQF